MYTINNKNPKDPTYSINFDSNKVDKYFNFHGSINVVSTEYALHVFLCAVDDYLKKHIDLELLCGIVNKIYWNDKFKFYLNFDNNLDFLLDELSELEYYKARGENEQIDNSIEKIKKYFEQNKHLLKNNYYHKFEIFSINP